MREVWSQEAVEPRARDRRQDRHHKHGRSAADQRDQRAGTRTCERPAEPEDRPANPVTATRPEGLWRDRDLLSGQRADLEPSDQRDGGCRHGPGRADDAVHVERLKPERLLDSEPGDDLGLREHDAEHDPEEKVGQHPLPRGRRRPELGGNGGGHWAQKSSGSTTNVAIHPPTKNPITATSEAFWKSASPEIACPEVQPPA